MNINKILLSIGLIFTLLSGCSRSGPVIERHIFGDYVLLLKTGNTSESSGSVFYEISDRSGIVVADTFLAGKDELTAQSDRYFSITPLRDQVYAFTFTSSPNSVAVLFDAKTRDSWPRTHENELPSQARVRANAILSATADKGSNLHLHVY